MQTDVLSYSRRVLVTAVGTGNYSEVRYELSGKVSSPNQCSSIPLCEVLSSEEEPLHLVALG